MTCGTVTPLSHSTNARGEIAYQAQVNGAVATIGVFRTDGANTVAIVRDDSVPATGGAFTAFVEELAKAGRPVVAVSFGSPYLLRAFPSVPAYLLAWGSDPVSQEAARRALLGQAPIGGRLPVTIMSGVPRGGGLDRAASR